MNLVIKPLVGRCQIIVAWEWETERKAEDCSSSAFSFSTRIIFYFAFEIQNDGFDKQHNIFYKLEDVT